MSDYVVTDYEWMVAISVLASDLGGYFVDALGLKDVYSPALKNVARRYAPLADSATNRGREFLRLVTVECGEYVAHALSRWRRLTYPYGMPDHQALSWSLVFARLVRDWDDNDAGSTEVPLVGPEEAWVRMLIRACDAAVDAAEIETKRVWDSSKSDWDAEYGSQRDHRDMILMHVDAGIFKRQMLLSWRELADVITRRQAASIIWWARKQPNMFIRAIRTPFNVDWTVLG